MSIIHDESSRDEPRLTKIASPDSNDHSDDELEGELPAKIGRYDVLQRVGRGGLCQVLLGHDSRLDRDVAIKIPRNNRKLGESVWQEFLHEARSAARLRHESIISVIDVDRTADGTPFVVMEYVDGINLYHYWRSREFQIEETIRILKQIATGLQFVHEHGLIHRDLKPTNIIIDRNGDARIADFGLALQLNAGRNSAVKTGIAGTSRFMSPEQLSGESHRIDERTDVWSLGVLLYWMCTGEYPFDGENFAELQEEIRRQSQRHLDEANGSVPKDLDRICRRCLSVLKQDRYPSAAALIEDLESLSRDEHTTTARNFRVPPHHFDTNITDQGFSPSRLDNVVPKGLQAYDENDAAFYLELLPGPRDRFGVPECLRFWLSRYQGIIGDFSHGLIYGPVGCGKTSFLKAGLIPHLPAAVEVIYVECSSAQTESDLTRLIGVRLKIDAVPVQLSELLRQIREGDHLDSGKRLLLVLDQFEQFLSGSSNLSSSQLSAALRQCDGIRIQCLLSVRDDYWMETQEFLRSQEIRIQDGRNSQAFPLFDKRHAEKVLFRFGQAYGAIPAEPDVDKSKHDEFIKKSVSAIADHGKVNCAHLAILAAVIRDGNWTSGQLLRVGGWQGIVVRFMNEQYSLPNSPVTGRRLLPQVRQIVEELMPEHGVSVASTGKTCSQLITACPTGTTAEIFQQAMRSLERDCRFIKSVSIDSESALSDGQKFQFSHDLLCEPLRAWLQQEQRLSWRGRARTDLEACSDLWHCRRNWQSFPSLFTLSRIKLAVAGKEVDSAQADFLSRAFRYQLSKWAIVLATLTVIIGFAGYFWRESAEMAMQRRYEKFLWSDSQNFMSMLESFKNEDLQVADLVGNIYLKTISEQLRHAAAQFYLGENRTEHATNVLNLIGDMQPSEYVHIVRFLKPELKAARVATNCETLFENATSLEARLKYAIVAYDLGDSALLQRIIESGDPNPTELTHLRHRFGEFGTISSEQIANAIVDENEPFSVRLFLLSVLHCDERIRDVATSQMNEILDFARKVYESSEQRYAHSLTKWTLEHHDRELPKLTAGDREQWRYLEQGITLIKVDGGELETGDSFETVGDFFVSDNLVTVRLFRQFLEDLDFEGVRPQERPYKRGDYKARHPRIWHFDKVAAPTDQHPVIRVSAIQAAMFCNWLSKKNGLEPVYEIRELGIGLNKDAYGFRLPTEPEFEYFSRQGCLDSSTFLGNQIDPKWIAQYAAFDEQQPIQPPPAIQNYRCGSRLPGCWGLFDTFGNVAEIVLNPSDNSFNCKHLGIASYAKVSYVFDGDPTNKKRNPTVASAKVGFRVLLDARNGQ